jgi:hypothetical protein
MRNIGDVDAELETAVFQYLDIDGIVEVPGGGRINRDRVTGSKIVAAEEILFIE